jgi:pSer/pThr/pTyr-binding forkhead associated (FHA) protein
MLRGYAVITCSRCGKDNQDHYKFCLGCGAKLEAAGGAPKAAPRPAPAAPPTPAPVPLPTPPPAPMAVSAENGSPRPRPAPAPIQPPATMVPEAAVPGSLPPRRAESGHGQAAAAGVLVAPSPRTTGSAVVARATAPASQPVVVSPSANIPTTIDGPSMPGMVPPRNDVPRSSEPTPGPTPGTVICPKCGKTVGGAFAFCGACGHRLRAAGAAPAAAVPPAGSGPIPRTMFGPSSGPAKAAARGHLTLIRPDGTEGGMHPLHDGENLIGRGQGSLFDADPYLSPRHAEFVLSADGLTLRDLRSLNGVFIKLIQEERIESSDIFRIGQELLRFDLIAPPAPLEDGTEIIGTPNPGYWGRISVVVGRDVDGPAFPLFDESIVLGRERGDILFPEDGYVSGTHAQIALRDGQVYLSDLGSSNGTFFRLRGTRKVPPGSLILMGQQLFRVAYR